MKKQLILLFMTACSSPSTPPEITINISDPAALPFPSASGIEWVDSTACVISDDNPNFFLVNESGILLKTIGTASIDYRTEKEVKADREAIFHLKLDGTPHVITLGSGVVSQHRDTAVILNMRTHAYKAYSISPLYNILRDKLHGDLNIEAAVANPDSVWLFHRGIHSDNLVVKLATEGFIQMLKTGEQPAYSIQVIRLPRHGPQAGIAGAVILPGSEWVLLVMTSEDTDNAYSDGTILGSYISLWKPGSAVTTEPMEIRTRVPLKIEGITIVREENDVYHGLMVSDDDHGGSLLIPFQLDLRE